MKLKRIWCFVAHWRRQVNEATTRYYAWRCDLCGERWRSPRRDNP